MKKVFFSFLIFAIIIVSILFIRQARKDLVITGFGNSGDSVTLLQSGNRITGFKFNCELGILGNCFANEKIVFYPILNDTCVSVKVDSSKVILLDTNICIPKNYKVPVLSFENPLENNYRRSVFLVDEGQQGIVIP